MAAVDDLDGEAPRAHAGTGPGSLLQLDAGDLVLGDPPIPAVDPYQRVAVRDADLLQVALPVVGAVRAVEHEESVGVDHDRHALFRLPRRTAAGDRGQPAHVALSLALVFVVERTLAHPDGARGVDCRVDEVRQHLTALPAPRHDRDLGARGSDQPPATTVEGQTRLDVGPPDGPVLLRVEHPRDAGVADHERALLATADRRESLTAELLARPRRDHRPAVGQSFPRRLGADE